MRKLTIKILLNLAVISSPPVALSQITSSDIKQSNVIIGSNNNVTATFINNKNYFSPGKLNILTRQLENHLAIVSNNSAEKASRDQKFHLAAEIWNQVFLDGKALKKPLPTLSAALTQQAAAEVNFNKIKAHKTLLEALEIDKENLSILETAASISIDLYKLDQAKAHLGRIIKISNARPKFPERDQLLYNTHYRLHIIESIEGNINGTISEAIECSRIFSDRFSPAEQQKAKGTQAVLLGIAMRAALDLTTIPENLSSAYVRSYDFINPSKNFNLLSTGKTGIWISLKDSKIIKIDENTPGETVSTMDGIDNAPEYLIGDTLEEVHGVVASAISKDKVKNIKTDPEIRRHLQQLYDNLIGISERCKECSISPIASAIAASFIGIFHEGSDDLESAHFFYSLALKRAQGANEHIKSTPAHLHILAMLYEKIGLLREKLTEGIGTFSNSAALELPLKSAIDAIDKILKDQPNNAKALVVKLRLLEEHHTTLKRSLKYSQAYLECKKTQAIFEQIANNSFVIDSDAANTYISCANFLLVDNRLRDNPTEFSRNLEILKAHAAMTGIDIDKSFFDAIDAIRPTK